MRVMINNGEEKGEDHPPPIPPVPPPSDAPRPDNGAAVSTLQQQPPSLLPPNQSVVPNNNSTSPPEHSLQANRHAPTPARPQETDEGGHQSTRNVNGKQRAPAAAVGSRTDSATDDVQKSEGNNGMMNEGRDVGGSTSTGRGKAGEQRTRRAAGSKAGAVSQGSSLLTGVISRSGGTGGGAAGFAAEVAAEAEVERAFEAELTAKGWELRRQEGDGNCLFRAISQQIYGDPGMHGDIRRQCLDFMRKERDHYSQFVAEAFDTYVSRKEQDGVHGNNPEIQAASELFNRPIEVYVPEKGAVPINIFHGGYQSGNAPIRVSYHGGSHYNAVIDPEEASVGQGLGVPGLSKEAAEKESLKRALAESCSSAHQVFPDGGSAFYKGGRAAHGAFGGGFVESDLRATEEELEQAAISASLADFHGNNGGGLYGSDTRDFGGSSTFGRSSTDSYLSATGKSDPSFAVPRRGGRGSNGALSAGRLSGRGAASRASSGWGERRGGASSAWAGDGGRSSGIGTGSGRADGGGWGGGGGGGGGGGSGNSPRKRRRPGSPTSPSGKPSRKSSPNSADSSSAVREMVWSYGFPLARVLHAHDLVGDSVEDMLVLLTSDAFQPPGNSPSASASASGSTASLGAGGM